MGWEGTARTRRGGAGEPEWLTLGQAAKFLGVAQSTLRKWADREIVPCIKTPGDHRRFLRRDLEQFLDRSRPGAREEEGPVVLIVDDDPGLRQFVRINLEAAGYAVREAGTAEEGLEALEEEPPALILLDVMLPKVDGWEMLRRVQERHGVGTIPVIMFSGKIDESSLAEATGRGAHEVVGKPFDPQQLIESTKKLVPV
jgi:excisionase family DNA binding protein